MDTAAVPPQVGEVLEKGQQAGSNTAKTIVSDVANTVTDQIGLRNEANSANQPVQPQRVLEPTQPVAENSEATKEMVSDYYSPSQVQFNANQAELEEQQRQEKLAQVRQQLAQELHNEVYFNEILNAGAAKPQTQLSEQDQMEEEKKQDQMQDLQKQQQKQEDLSKFRAERAVEIKGGIVG